MAWFAQAFEKTSMATSLPSRVWSCETLQRGLSLVQSLPMTLDAPNEPELQDLEAELAKLEVGCYTLSKSVNKYHIL